MDSRIEIKHVVIFFIILIIVFGWCLYIKDNKEETHYNQYQIELQSLKDSISHSQKLVDSLNIVVSIKGQTIINNIKIYEAENIKIGKFNRTITDSLFKANLQSGYKKYGHFISK